MLLRVLLYLTRFRKLGGLRNKILCVFLISFIAVQLKSPTTYISLLLFGSGRYSRLIASEVQAVR